MKVMVCQPGHTFSTIDCYLGLCAGLRMNGVEVVAFEWTRMLQILGGIVGDGAYMGVSPEALDKRREFLSWLAAADAVSIAVDSEVDAVIVVNGILFPASRTMPLRKLGIPIACFGTEAPYFLETEQQLAPFYTHWFTNERRCVKDFIGLTQAFYLPHAYNPETHTLGAADPEKACDVVFVGGGYPERKALLDGVTWNGYGLVTRGTLWHLDLVSERGAADAGRMGRYAEGAIPNTETCAWHRSARVALNLHRKMTMVETGGEVAAGAAESLGPRAYEIPAVGGFLLSDDERPEIGEVYGDAAATFRAWDSDDLSRQVDYWLTHDDAREAMQRAQREAVAPHHWGNRAKYVLECIL